jgi:hypothetical protein
MDIKAYAEQITSVAGLKLNNTPKGADIRTDMPATPDNKEGEDPGRDGFDKALRAAARVYRDSMLIGFGRDETGFSDFFKPNSPQRKQFYSLMAQYQSFEALRLAERFSK